MSGRQAGTKSARKAGQFNQSVARAAMILDAFAAADGDMELGITELSEATGLAKSVVSRTVAPLVACGYLEQNARTRRYRVGLRMFELGLRYLRRPGAREVALALLEDLVRETGHTAYLGVLDGFDCVVLAAVEGRDRLRVVVSAGERAPVHVTAMGKAILSQLDDEEREELLVKGWPQQLETWRILSPDALREDLRLARERGYAVTREDGYPGIWSVGVALPVGGRGGDPMGGAGEPRMAVSVDIPAFGASEEKLHALGRLLVEKTRRLTSALCDERPKAALGILGQGGTVHG